MPIGHVGFQDFRGYQQIRKPWSSAVRSLDCGSRASADAQASANTYRALGAQRIFYKYCATFDSTEEGNIGPIAEALMATLETDRTIFCPAFPEYTVTVFQGRMFLSHIMLGNPASVLIQSRR
ncbi:MAG: hypothetical protein CM15mP120_09700 [Pseudomonadota bacterium]|nr:MAG: hypothetical protein CM15mP120_09700 [Pseudomonadota bacterium]